MQCFRKDSLRKEGSLGKSISLSLGVGGGGRRKKVEIIVQMLASKNKIQLSELPGYLTPSFLCSNKYMEEGFYFDSSSEKPSASFNTR